MFPNLCHTCKKRIRNWLTLHNANDSCKHPMLIFFKKEITAMLASGLTYRELGYNYGVTSGSMFRFAKTHCQQVKRKSKNKSKKKSEQ